VIRTCDACQVSYDAKRPSSKYCSDRCRKRAQRGDIAPVVPITQAIHEGSLTAATLAELEAAEMSASSMGQAALMLARRLDLPSMDTGSSIAALVREHRATLSAAVDAGKVAEDPLDQLAQQRRQRIANG
jgi:hypothetical protein